MSFGVSAIIKESNNLLDTPEPDLGTKSSSELYLNHMKSRGIGLIVLLLVFSGLAAVGAGGYLLYTNLTNSDSSESAKTDSGSKNMDSEKVLDERLSPEEKQLYEEVKDELKDMQVLYESIKSNEPLKTVEGAQIASLQAQVQQDAQSITSKDPCTGSIEDIEKALQTAEKARKLGMDDLVEELTEWIQDAVHSIAADASTNWPTTWGERFASGEFDDRLIDIDTHEIREGIGQADPIIRDWLYHAQLARLVGLTEVSYNITNRDYSELTEWREKKCKKGCCKHFEGFYTKEQCDTLGGEWHEKCPGYKVYMRGYSHSDLPGGGTGDAEYVFRLHTCDENVYSSWTGTRDLYWTWTTYDGGVAPTNLLNKPVSFEMSKEGKGSAVLASGMGNQTVVYFETDGKQMSFRVEWGNLTPVYGLGLINKGSGLCD